MNRGHFIFPAVDYRHKKSKMRLFRNVPRRFPPSSCFITCCDRVVQYRATKSRTLEFRDKRNTITFYAVALTGDSTQMFPLLGKQSTEHNLGIKRLSPTGNGTGEPLD